MTGWVKLGSNGYRKFNAGELTIKAMDLDDGTLYRIEEEVEIASGHGGTLSVVRPYFVLAPRVMYVPKKEE